MIDTGWQAEFQPDRRDAIRRRTRHKAVIVLNGGWSTLNAEILNVSADGALVQLDGICSFPDAFQLRYDGLKDMLFGSGAAASGPACCSRADVGGLKASRGGFSANAFIALFPLAQQRPRD